MNRLTSFIMPIIALTLFSLASFGSLAPALAATVTDTFPLTLTGTERCRDNPKFVTPIKVKATAGMTITFIHDGTVFQATLNTHGGNATIDAMTLNGRAFLANKLGSIAQLVLSGTDPGNPDYFMTLRGKATFDKAGKLTKVTGTFVYQVLSGLGGIPNSDCFGSGTVATGKNLTPPPNGLISTPGDDPQIVSDGAGGAIIVWVGSYSGTDADIYAQRVNGAGEAQWTANGVHITTGMGTQDTPRVIPDGAGGAIITWRDTRAGISIGDLSGDIFAQRINSAGVVLWAVNGVPIGTGDWSFQENPRLVTDGVGGAIIVWEDSRGGSPVYAQIYAQRVNGAGVTQWAVDGIPLRTLNDGSHEPRLVTDGAGGAIIVWYRPFPDAGSQIYAQRVNSTGALQWTTNGVLLTNFDLDISGHWIGGGAFPSSSPTAQGERLSRGQGSATSLAVESLPNG